MPTGNNNVTQGHKQINLDANRFPLLGNDLIDEFQEPENLAFLKLGTPYLFFSRSIHVRKGRVYPSCDILVHLNPAS